MRYWARDADGNIAVDPTTVDKDYHDTNPVYRGYMREVLYGRRRNSKVANNLVFSRYGEDESLEHAPETTHKADYCEKHINLAASREEVKNISEYIKSSHFSLDTGSRNYEPVSKATYVPIEIARSTRCVNTDKAHQRYAPIFSDERMGNNMKSMYSSSFKSVKPTGRVTLPLEKDKNKTHFHLGNDETEYAKSSESTCNYDDFKDSNANQISAAIKKQNSKSHVLNSPEKEILDYKSTTKVDFDKREVNKQEETEDEGFASHSRGSNITIGSGGSFSKIGSEYSNSFDSNTISNQPRVLSTKRYGDSVQLKDEETKLEVPKSQHQSNYTPKTVEKSETADDLKKLNSQSSIQLGSSNVTGVALSKSDYQKKDYCKADPYVEARSKNPISMKDAMPDVFTSLNNPVSYDYGTIAAADRAKCYQESKTSLDKALYTEKMHSLRFDGKDERFVVNPSREVFLSSKEARQMYEKTRQRKVDETSFERTNMNTLGSFMSKTQRYYTTSSSAYGAGCEKTSKVVPNSWEPAKFMFDQGLRGLTENRERYPLPEVMLTRESAKYVDEKIKPPLYD